MDIKELKELIDATIYTNGEKKIKASSHQTMLHEIVDSSFEKAGVIDAKVDDVDERLKESLVDINEKTESLANDLEATNTKLDSGLEKTKLDDLVLSQKIDNLASNIIGLGNNIKGEAKGGGVINLPPIALNSVSPGYAIEGLTATQLVQNGAFKEGTKGWFSPIATLAIKDDFLTSTSTSSSKSGLIRQKTTPFKEHIVFLYASLASDKPGTGVSFQIERGLYSSTQLNDEGFTNISSRFSLAAETLSGSGEFQVNASGAFAIGDTLSLKVFGLLNLTELFGAGNEPTKEWCDEHFPEYFDGTKSVELPVRIKSVGENLLDYLDSNNHTKNTKIDNGYITGNIGGALITVLRFKVYKDTPYCLSFLNRNKVTTTALKYSIQTNPGPYNVNNTLWITAEHIDENQAIKSTVITPKEDGYHHFIVNTATGATDIMLGKGGFSPYKKYIDNIAYINSKATLKSALQAKDYVENGTLFKNIFTTKAFKKDDVGRQYINESLVNNYAFYLDIDENKWLKDGFVNNNRIARFSDGETYSCVGSTISTDVEDIVFLIDSARNYIMLKINKSKVDELSGATPLDKFKAYWGSRTLEVNYQANVEKIKLDTSGVVTTHENGTIFIDYIKNRTDIYNKGIEVLDFKELVSLQKYEGVDLVELDISKAKYASNKLTHLDLKDGDIVFFEYRYTDLSIYGENTIEYFNQNNVLQSENGKVWRKVEVATNDGQLTTKLEEVK